MVLIIFCNTRRWPFHTASPCPQYGNLRALQLDIAGTARPQETYFDIGHTRSMVA